MPHKSKDADDIYMSTLLDGPTLAAANRVLARVDLQQAGQPCTLLDLFRGLLPLEVSRAVAVLNRLSEVIRVVREYPELFD